MTKNSSYITRPFGDRWFNQQVDISVVFSKSLQLASRSVEKYRGRVTISTDVHPFPAAVGSVILRSKSGFSAPNGHVDSTLTSSIAMLGHARCYASNQRGANGQRGIATTSHT